MQVHFCRLGKVKLHFRCGQLCVCAIKSLAGQKGIKWSRGNLSNDHSFCCTDSFHRTPFSRKMHCNCFPILVPFFYFCLVFYFHFFSCWQTLATIFLRLLLWRSHYFCFNLHLAADKAAATGWAGLQGHSEERGPWADHVHHYSWQAQASAWVDNSSVLAAISGQQKKRQILHMSFDVSEYDELDEQDNEGRARKNLST